MKQQAIEIVRFCIGVFIGIGIVISINVNCYAFPPVNDFCPENEQLEVVVKKSRLINLHRPATRVSIVAPEIADVQVLDPQQILLTGQKVGETTLIIWDEMNKPRMIDVVVRWNTKLIKETIRNSFPDEAIDVVPLNQGVLLKGQARDIGNVDQALHIANSFAPRVINMISTPGIHQVMLKVRIAEVARSFREEIGFNFQALGSDVQAGSVLGNLVSGTINSTDGVSVSDAVTLFLGFPNSNVAAFIQALNEKGMLRMLAEPNLVARSGEKASFLAGGEYPIPVSQGGLGGNAITIEYREYGVKLDFTPTVLNQNSIHLDIEPEVSDLDFANGVELSGVNVPGLITRKAKTVIRLQNGQTFAIAGLISRSKQKIRRKVPVVGDIPLLGGIFRGGELTENETELLIMVTPHLIAPINQPDLNNLPGHYGQEKQSEEFTTEDEWSFMGTKPVPNNNIESSPLPDESVPEIDLGQPSNTTSAESVNAVETRSSKQSTEDSISIEEYSASKSSSDTIEANQSELTHFSVKTTHSLQVQEEPAIVSSYSNALPAPTMQFTNNSMTNYDVHVERETQNYSSMKYNMPTFSSDLSDHDREVAQLKVLQAAYKKAISNPAVQSTSIQSSPLPVESDMKPLNSPVSTQVNSTWDAPAENHESYSNGMKTMYIKPGLTPIEPSDSQDNQRPKTIYTKK
jgi:pilus assembly protein CpaC